MFEGITLLPFFRERCPALRAPPLASASRRAILTLLAMWTYTGQKRRSRTRHGEQAQRGVRGITAFVV